MIDVVLGLGFGDEGKGTIVDWLARRAAAPPVVVRWSGGPQAAHHVVTDDGRTHCFAQLGSGSFVAGARTHLGPGMAVDPYALHVEAAAFGEAGILARVSIDPRAVVVTPWHAIVNRVRELLRGPLRHGSTGRGVAEAVLGPARLVAGELAGPGLAGAVDRLAAALRATAAGLVDAHPAPPDAARALVARAADPDLRASFLDAARALEPAGVAITPHAPRAASLILEGAQGVLLDRDHGFAPHVTPGRSTRRAAEEACRALDLAGPLQLWGVLRAFHTRHGEGPFPSESAALAALLPEPHNPPGVAGAFRVGWFDGVLARYALAVAGPIDHLVVTCVDRVATLDRVAVVESWDAGRVVDLTAVAAAERTAVTAAAVPVVRDVASIVDAIESLVGQPVAVESWGMTASAKRARRA